jgi:hypothetical protein
MFPISTSALMLGRGSLQVPPPWLPPMIDTHWVWHQGLICLSPGFDAWVFGNGFNRSLSANRFFCSAQQLNQTMGGRTVVDTECQDNSPAITGEPISYFFRY